MIDWTSRRVGEPEPGIGVTVHRLDSGRPGPRLLVVGGVHGNEIGGIVGAGRLTRQPWPLIAGSLEVVPVLHEAAHAAFVRTGPADDRDLARTFPGDPDGSPTERLAHLVLTQLITGADGLIDLHTSSPDADLPFFAGAYGDDSPVAQRSTAMARAFGLEVLWTHPTVGAGRTLSVAAERGIPAMYVESRTGGVLAEPVIAAYSEGVLRVCEAWGLLPAGTAPPGVPLRLWLHGSGDTDTFTPAERDGYFLAEVDLLDPVRAGDRIGRVIDFADRVVAPVLAAADGRVVFLRRAAKITAGTPLVSVCPEHPPEIPAPVDQGGNR